MEEKSGFGQKKLNRNHSFKRSEKLGHKEAVKLTHAYIILSCTEKNERQILIGQKQVISYTALSKLRKKIENPNMAKHWEEIKRKISLKEPTIEKNGKVAGLGKRFSSVLLPAGGKSSFFGGSIEKAELPKQAAIRELREELNIHPKFEIDEFDLQEICSTDWGGIYYSIDLNIPKYELLKEHLLAIDSLQNQIIEFEENLDLLSIYNHQLSLPREAEIPYPEMHRFRWIKMENCTDYLKTEDKEYIQTQAALFCELLARQLSVENEEHISFFSNSIAQHIINNEPTDGNILAVQILVDKLKNAEIEVLSKTLRKM